MKGQGTVKGILVTGDDGQEYLLGFEPTRPVPTPTLSRRTADGRFEAYTRAGSAATNVEAAALAARLESEGAGEILITSIDRDGTLAGYDLELVRQVAAAVRIPVIASGGACSYADFEAALREAGASAVAASAMFQFTQQTPLGAKQYLRERGVPVRL